MVSYMIYLSLAATDIEFLNGIFVGDVTTGTLFYFGFPQLLLAVILLRRLRLCGVYAMP
jgi:uncharacterized membrane protein (DUF485 family)